MYDEWRRRFDCVERGAQQWSTRERVYRALAARSAQRAPTRDWLLKAAGISSSGFYKSFGTSAPHRLVDDDPMAVVVIETKEWSWSPYRHGVLDVADEVVLAPRVLLEALVRALAEWAIDNAVLAGYHDARPPSSAVFLAADALVALGGAADGAEELLRTVIRRAVDRRLDESSVGVLNAVRPAIEEAVGEHPATHGSEATAAAVEVLSDYAHRILAGDEAWHAGHDEVRQLVDRLRALARENP